MGHPYKQNTLDRHSIGARPRHGFVVFPLGAARESHRAYDVQPMPVPLEGIVKDKTSCLRDAHPVHCP